MTRAAMRLVVTVLFFCTIVAFYSALGLIATLVLLGLGNPASASVLGWITTISAVYVALPKAIKFHRALPR